jgi:hypothetical protein
MNKSPIKYIISIISCFLVGFCSTTYFLTKREPVKSIDTIICKTNEGYGEDIETGEKFLVVSTICDTIYKK